MADYRPKMRLMMSRNVSIFKLILLVLLPALTAVMANGPKYPEMKGVHLRISATQWPPVITYQRNPDGSVTYRGIVVEILKFVAQSLELTYSFLILNETEIATAGVIQTNLKALLNDEVDMAGFGFVITYDRFKQMDFSPPVLIQDYHMLVPYPTEESRLLAPIHPFQPIVWVCLVGSLIAMVIAFACLSGLYRKYVHSSSPEDLKNKKVADPSLSSSAGLLNYRSLSNYTLYMVTILTNHGQRIVLKQISFRLAVATWCLMAVILVNAYSGTLFSYMAVPKLNPIVNTFEELAEKYPDQKPTIDANSVMAQLFLSATNGPFKVLGDSLRAHPNSQFKKRADLSKLMSTIEYVYPQMDLVTNPALAEGYDRTSRKCRYTYSKVVEPFKQFTPVVLGLKKNGPYSKAIKSQIQILLDTGLLNHWIRENMFRADPCLLQNYNAGAKQKALSLVDLAFAFVIFGMGIGLAVMGGLVELVFASIHRKWSTLNKERPIRKKKTGTTVTVAAAEAAK